jgi:PAS domain S-box-containing protein
LEREVRERKLAEEKIHQLNVDLEQRVQERTAQHQVAIKQLQEGIADRLRAETALRQSEARLVGIVNSAMDGIITVDGQQRIVVFNAAAELMFRCTAKDMIGHPLDRLIPPRFARTHHEHIQRFGETGVTTRRMGALQAVSGLRADGEEFPIEASISQIESDGQRFFTVILRDITERARSEAQILASLKEKEVLLKEVHHRVKNNLQIISSLLNLQSSRSADSRTQAILKENQNRVRSMALIHEQLYLSGNLAAIDVHQYIQRLAQQVLNSFSDGHTAVSLHTDIEHVPVNADTAIACGLIINELISNALKYAFRGREAGEIRIALARGDDQVRLRIADNGVGLPAGFDAHKTETLGLQIVRTLTEQLRGTLSIDTSNGTQITIEFSLPPESSRPKVPLS